MESIPRKLDANKDTAIGNYLDVVYPTYLEPIRFEPLRLLEIGVFKGDSLRMWRDYLPNSLIFGLDINPTSNFVEDRIRTFIGNQTDPLILATLPEPFDIIIDDGSHICQDQLRTYEVLFPRLTAGGLYFIEDVRLARKENWNTADTLTPFFSNLASDVATNRNNLVSYVHFWRNMIVVRKEKAWIT